MINQVSKLRLSFSLPAIILLVAPITHAANDWNTPCFDGVCEYSLTAAPGQNGSGTVQIWGSSNAISDITTAAGWQILNCSSTAMAQDICLVCMNNDTAGCQHLFQGGDAEGKLVRLPENCGMSAFARVAKSYIPDDQSLPADITARFIRRDGNSSTPEVQGLSLDTNWSAIDPTKYGNVNIAVRGANVPGADVNGTLVPTSSSRRSSRGLTDFVGDAIDSLKGLDSFNFNKSFPLPPISVNKAVTILNKDLKCGPFNLNANVSVDGKASAQISVGAAASGTIIPPKIDDFAALVLMNGDLDGTLNLNAAISTTFDTGKIEVVPSVGIPGLDFPAVFTVGPSFDISAEATAELDLAADLQVGIVYSISNAQLIFPDKNGQSGGGFNVGDTPLTLSLTPSVKSTGSLTAHLIPSLNLGVQAFSASATVFLDLDASATVALSLDAVDSNNITINSGSNSSSSDSSSTTASSNSTRTSSGSSSTTASLNSTSTLSDSSSTTTSLNLTSTSVAHQTSSVTSAALPSNSTSAAASDNSTSVPTTSNTTSATVLSSSIASTASALSAARNSKGSKAPVKPTSIVQAISAAKRAAASSANATSSSNSSSSSVSESSSGVQFGGCVEIDTGLSVNAGAQGSFFGLFDASTQVPLFSKEFVLFKKCFGNGDSTPSRRSLASPLGPGRPLHRNTSPRKIDAVHERAAVAAAKAPVASSSPASDSEACLSSSFAPPIPVTNSTQISSNEVTVKPV
ncbi:hypothetical protein GYMLUDRAFT_40982 [Collybiopsis luxurians FD-317 M1]|uniref:Uncharacterized protein n=1 Tax=Collybiopsis luxurians FD-317 M1 TaxID=944289 RepID=A0A0D0D241_9AGAR|nr:hypothetical protein GYMLUDRAFT_40982 [Collybiopsis luxurians FD-317 M1]